MKIILSICGVVVTFLGMWITALGLFAFVSQGGIRIIGLLFGIGVMAGGGYLLSLGRRND